MSWQDWGDIRQESRGKKDDLFSHKNRKVTWTSGEAAAVDSKVAERNHRKAMEAQRKAEELARKKEDLKAKREQEEWKKKQEKKDRKKAKKEEARRNAR